MKNLQVISISFAMTTILLLETSAQIKMDVNGRVGINTNPTTFGLTTTSAKFTSAISINGTAATVTIKPSSNSAYLIIDGTGYYGAPNLHPNYSQACNLGSSSKAYKYVYSHDFIDPSDARIKENIKPISNALDLVLQLNGLKYDLKKDENFDSLTLNLSEEQKEKFDKDRCNKLGFLAQDVQKVIPEVVIYDEEEDRYSISYSKIIPVLVEAIKEQNMIIESLMKDTEELKTQNESAELKSTSDNSDLVVSENTGNTLFQNYPNPFTETTLIEYYLEESVTEAMICI